MKLSEMIRASVSESSLDVACEVTPGHYSKAFATIVFERMGTVSDGEAKMITVKLVACPECFAAYVYDLSKVGFELQHAAH